MNIRNSSRKYLLQNEDYSSVFSTLSCEEKTFVVLYLSEGKGVCYTYLSEGKGVMLYEKIKSYEDLDVEPEVGFFAKINFLVYSKTKYFRKRTMKMLNIFGRYCA